MKTNFYNWTSSTENNCLDGFSFLQTLKFGEYDFLTDLMLPFSKKFLWNDFFQFVLIYSLAPMPAIVYGI